MRVALLVRQYHPSLGGLEHFVASLAQALRLAGTEPHIFTLNRVFNRSTALAGKEEIDGVLVRRWPFVGFQRYFTPLVPPDTLRDYDVVHVHGIDGMFEFAAGLKRRRGQALLATTHGLFFHTRWMAPLKQAYYRSITARQFSRFDAVIANSSADAAMVAPYHPAVRIIANGVEPLADSMSTGSRLLTVGRIAPHKRVDRLIEAVAQPALRDAHLDVVGPEWGVKIAALRAHAANLGVAHRVVFHGAVDRQSLARLALRAGVFISASAYEGFGMALVEAMGAGLVPVAQPNASFQELLAEADVGSLADFSDPVTAANAVSIVRQTMSSSDRARAMAFAQRFSWDTHARKTMAFYREALGIRREQPHQAPVNATR